MNVLFIPDYRQGNPYQQALADALSRHGANVHFDVHFTGVFSISRAISRVGKCNLIHIHWTNPFLLSHKPWRSIIKSCLFLSELLLLKILGVRIVWTVHNITFHEEHHRQIELFFSRLLLRLCDHVIVHCRAALREVIQTYKSALNGRVAIVPHGHYINHYENHVSQAHARDLLQIGPKDVVFLYFGVIRPYKGIAQLIEAFKKLKLPQARLLITGDVPKWCEDIKMQIQDQCKKDKRIRTVLEFVPSDQIQVYMNAANVVVMPFQDVLTSGSVLLAMGFAKAIIAPRLGCIPEVLNEEGAILYDPNAEDCLYEALRKACQLDLESMGRYNFNQADQFDWNEIGKMTYEVYKKCLANRSLLPVRS